MSPRGLTLTSRWWRGAAVGGSMLVTVAGILCGAALVRGFTAPATAPDGHTALLVDGRLVITHADGRVTVVDPSMLGDTEQLTVLVAGDQLYLVNRRDGTIWRLEPASGARVGRPWSARGPLADAVVDGAGTLWALETGGRLHRLAWTDDRLVADGAPTRVAGANEESMLLALPTGVTVITPGSALAIRVGTGSDGPVPAPTLTPAPSTSGQAAFPRVGGGTGATASSGGATAGTRTTAGAPPTAGAPATAAGTTTQPTTQPTTSPGPGAGNEIITGFSERVICASCRLIQYRYTITLNPAAWPDVPGICRLHVTPPLNADSEITCGATSAVVGSGTGDYVTVSAQTCTGAANCITLDSIEFWTRSSEPNSDWEQPCGDGDRVCP